MTDYCENGKPKDCRYCYYYGRHGCMLKVCYQYQLHRTHLCYLR